MTVNKTHKIVYKWAKIPVVLDENASKLEKTQTMALKAVQFVVFDAVTSTLAAAHGYRVKELERNFGNKPYVIYISGTKEECLKHLADLRNKKGMGFANIKAKILGQPKLRLLSKKNKEKLRASSDDKIEEIKLKLLGCWVDLDVYMEKI